MMHDAQSETSPSLIQAAKANNADAWHRLVNIYSRSVYRWCRTAGLQSADAGNVVQEVLRSVARKLPEFRHEQPHDSFRGWIRRITQNKINDHFRIENRDLARGRGGTDAHRGLNAVPDDIEPTWASDASRISPTAGGGESELVRQINAVRSEVSSRDWRVFWRVAVDGQSAVEVGKEFGMSANAVRLVKMRLLRRLRRDVMPPE